MALIVTTASGGSEERQPVLAAGARDSRQRSGGETYDLEISRVPSHLTSKAVESVAIATW